MRAKFKIIKGIALAMLFIALMLAGVADMQAQPQDSSRLLWTHNFGLGWEVLGAKFFPDGERLVVALYYRDDNTNQETNRVVTLSVATGEILDTLEGLNQRTHSLFFSKDGRFLYHGSRKYDLLEKRFVDSIPSHIGASAIALSPIRDEIYVAAFHTSGTGPYQCLDSNLLIITATTLSPTEYKTVDALVKYIIVSPDGNFLITDEFDTGCFYGGWEPHPQSKEMAIILRDAVTLEESRTIPKKSGRYGVIATSEQRSIGDILLSPDGKLLASHIYEDSIYIWNTSDWSFVGGFKAPHSHSGNILFSCNSKYLFASYFVNDSDRGTTVYSTMPPFAVVHRFPSLDQNGEKIGINPEDISCIQDKLIVSRLGKVFCLTIPDFITSVEPEQGPKAQDVIYPNPTNGNVLIVFNEPITEPTQVQIANEQGAIVFQAMLKAGTKDFQWNTSGMGAGLYLCTVRNKTIFKTYKIMVSK